MNKQPQQEERRLLAVLAHPDDESLGNGGMLARYAAEGVQTYLVTATRGEEGWFGPPEENPGPVALGRIREAELRAAGQVLGIREIRFLDYVDGRLDQADPEEVIAKIIAEVRRIRPHVVVTFDDWGLYGHPDHIAISRFTTEAVGRAALDERPDLGPPHAVAALYYMAWTRESLGLYESAFGQIEMEVDGEVRRPLAWPEHAISVRVDASDHWETVWRAIACHRSQLPGYESLLKLPESYHRRLWGNQTYVQASGGNSDTDRVAETFFDRPGKPADLLMRPLITTLRSSGRAPAVTTRKENFE